MRRFLLPRLLPRFLLLLCLCPALSSVLAQGMPVVLEGEHFTKKFIGTPPNGDKLIELIREHETFERWTRLVAFRYQKLPALGNDPKHVAQALANSIKSVNPQAPSKMLFNGKTNEAIVDFLTWPADGKFMEFNLFRYARSADGKAVISLQLAYRFTDRSPDGIERFKKLRNAWINYAALFDMRLAYEALGP